MSVKKKVGGTQNRPIKKKSVQKKSGHEVVIIQKKPNFPKFCFLVEKKANMGKSHPIKIVKKCR